MIAYEFKTAEKAGMTLGAHNGKAFWKGDLKQHQTKARLDREFNEDEAQANYEHDARLGMI